MDRFKSLAVFKAVADNGGFNKAAEALRLSNAAVTRCVQDLEARLGVRLLRRTTRRVWLTPIGQDVLRRAKELLASYEELEAVSSLSATDPCGEVRLVAPLSYGRRFLGRALASYAASYPKVWVDVRLHEPPLNPASNEADLTLCFAGELRDSLVARRVAEVQVGVYASPNYLARNGTPLHPTALERHDCLTCGGSGESAKWQLCNAITGERCTSVAMQPRRSAAGRRCPWRGRRAAAGFHGGGQRHPRRTAALVAGVVAPALVAASRVRVATQATAVRTQAHRPPRGVARACEVGGGSRTIAAARRSRRVARATPTGRSRNAGGLSSLYGH